MRGGTGAESWYGRGGETGFGRRAGRRLRPVWLVAPVAGALAVGFLPGVAPAAVSSAAVTPRSVTPTSNYAVIKTIAMGGQTSYVAVSDDDTVYVTVNPGAGDDSVAVIPPGQLTVDDSIGFGGQGATGIAALRDDSVYVTSETPGELSVLGGGLLRRSLSLNEPAAVAVDEVDDTVYVALSFDDKLSILRSRNLDDSVNIPVGDQPEGVAVNNVDDTVYVTNKSSGSVHVINGRNTDDSQIISLGAGTQPVGVAVNQTDDTVYIANSGTGTMTVIDGKNPASRQILVLGQLPQALAVDDSVTADVVYVGRRGMGSGYVSVINGRNLDDSVSISLGANPGGMAVRRDGTAYVADADNRNAVYVLAKVTPTLVTTSGIAGAPATLTLSVPGGYAADDTTVKTVTFGSSPATAKTQTGTNQWRVTVPSGSGTVPVTVTFKGDLKASAGSFTYSSSPNPDPTPVYPPTAPLGAAATPGNGSATVTWVAPSNAGSFPITHYQAVSTPSGGTCLVAAPATSCEVTGLANGTTYTFAVRALNGAGWGDYSPASNPVRPTGATPAPAPVPVPPLEPGQSQLVVDGKVTPVQVDPNSRADGLTITGDDFSMNLTGLGRDGQPLNLSPEGALILNEDRQVDTSGSGFQAASEVDLYIDPPTLVTTSGRSARAAEATYVGTLLTDGKGAFAGRPTLPAGISAGKHILQAVGLTKSGAPRAMSLGVLVTPDISITFIKGTRKKDVRHDRIRATGTTSEVPAGTKLVPYVQYRGQGAFTKGKASIVVKADGTFTWTRRVLSSKSITAFVAWEDVASNRVVWARIG